MAPIKSAILFGSEGAQIKLEIPHSSADGAIAMTRNGQGRNLLVVVYEDRRDPTQLSQ